MAYRWDIVLQEAPQMTPYTHVIESSDPPIDQEDSEGQDTYLTEDFLTPTHSIPGIPSRYAAEQREGRALYVRGAARNWQNDVVCSIFRLWGTVEKLPVLISLGADQTFRWVVMANETEAVTAMEKLNGRRYEHGCLVISMSLPPGRTLTLVNKELLPHHHHQLSPLSIESEVYEDPEQTPRQRQFFLGHPPPPPIQDTSNEKTPTIHTFAFRVEDTDAARTKDPRRVESLYSDPFYVDDDNQPFDIQEDLYSDFDSALYPAAEDIETPELQQPTKFWPLANPVKDAAPVSSTSWASITASANPDTKVVDLKPEQKTNYRLKPVGRIPSVTRTDVNDNARLVFLFDLPSTITYADVSNAIVEGPLIKMRFGIDSNTQKRFCGVVFQHSHDALAFQKSLDEEKRLSQPKRFRFLVDHARDTQDGLEQAIKVMGPPVFATRRLTIVKAGFFFMFGERQLRDACDKLVGEDTVQLIWLYNGGNATIVFTDVSSAVKVKNEFDRRARRAEMGAADGYAIWAGLTTTYSKDPCVVPLELKTRLQN